MSRIKNSLQEFMNSVDLKIIKKMEQDQKGKKALLFDMPVGEGMELILYLNKVKRIPLEILNEKASLIQKTWRKKANQNVIPYYSNLFFRNPTINSKAAI